ncbi:hypothetical protein PVAP13_2KG045932 [Panicum virgatum]|uniref:Uncharacterized protein n=1 Tax=Panicum virgatum TaxID=38727 RepID=A0A8T0VUG1_PANVG|nr:hypothetical protein PVAP13_2KG045932 [Panicum virgatum]
MEATILLGSTRTHARQPARSSWAPGGGVAWWPAVGEGGGPLPLQRSLGEGEAAEGAGDWRHEGEREEGSPAPGSGEGGGRRARHRRRHLRPCATPPWRHLRVRVRGRRCRSVSARPASRRPAATATTRARCRGCSALRRGGTGLERRQRCASPEQRSSRLAGHRATPPPGAADTEGEGGEMEREMTCGTRTKGTLVLSLFCLSYPIRKYNF